MAIVLMISCGVAMTSHGELHFNLTGFLIQAAAVVVRLFLVFLLKIVLPGWLTYYYFVNLGCFPCLVCCSLNLRDL